VNTKGNKKDKVLEEEEDEQVEVRENGKRLST